jgi:hypothetical protein
MIRQLKKSDTREKGVNKGNLFTSFSFGKKHAILAKQPGKLSIYNENR